MHRQPQRLHFDLDAHAQSAIPPRLLAISLRCCGDAGHCTARTLAFRIFWTPWDRSPGVTGALVYAIRSDSLHGSLCLIFTLKAVDVLSAIQFPFVRY